MVSKLERSVGDADAAGFYLCILHLGWCGVSIELARHDVKWDDMRQPEIETEGWTVDYEMGGRKVGSDWGVDYTSYMSN